MLMNRRLTVLTIEYNGSQHKLFLYIQVLIFNKPFLANFLRFKNVYSSLNALIFVNMAWKCGWRISKFKLDIAECQ